MALLTRPRSLRTLTQCLRVSSSSNGPCNYRNLSANRVQHQSSALTSNEEELSPVSSMTSQEIAKELQRIRLPRAVQATYLTPLRRAVKHGDTVAQLQMRSYSVRNLEAFADFAMRAAYYLELPALGPNPLPRITQRWTVPKSTFVHKKSQENFERVTLRRLITICDGHPETVSIWLAFLQKYRYYGIGMKANVWERSGLNVAEDMEADGQRISQQLGEHLDLVRGLKNTVNNETLMQQIIHAEPYKASWGSYAPMAAAVSVPHANSRIETQVVQGERDLDKTPRTKDDKANTESS